jgi:hypothetical protein
MVIRYSLSVIGYQTNQKPHKPNKREVSVEAVCYRDLVHNAGGAPSRGQKADQQF